MADTIDLGSIAERRAGSRPVTRTKQRQHHPCGGAVFVLSGELGCAETARNCRPPHCENTAPNPFGNFMKKTSAVRRSNQDAHKTNKRIVDFSTGLKSCYPHHIECS